MDTTLDYESIETSLGDKLRLSDNLDIHADHFFPVSLLDKLFHYSEQSRGTERDYLNRTVHRNFHGHDFDRWIDNIVAHTRLDIIDDEGSARMIDLIDIDSLTFNDDHTITATLPDETKYTLLDSDTHRPLQADNINDISVNLDLSTMFERPPVDSDSEPYLGFGPIAHIVRVVCDKSDITPSKVNATELSDRIFAHFKHEMLPLIPSLWNDMEHIMHYGRPRLSPRSPELTNIGERGLTV